ncbi:D-Ala-D-Ala carboxypeptidase family metallohydrolase [Muricauda sp. MAR_2010_75]|uniref:YcbK family protein n=1 Tax=Allomuricauda sp. MAR_2010_75 TaxID=1250232 RepID=UPI00055B8811|nr:D-Ala-D-Ala carboxypeptidase family metallohydrolase [Muricauda sp. MAR_2010_75]
MLLTTNFSLGEFTRNYDRAVTDSQMSNLERLASNLQALRNYVGKPVFVNSGLRSVEHNEAVGGVKDSRHLYGQAADIRVDGMTTQQLNDAIEHLVSIGEMEQGGLGIYDTWVHYDVRGVRARWDNRKKKAQ